MNVWTYTIKGKSGTITTQNFIFAEQKSRLGYPVYCRREKNTYFYIH